MPTTYWTNCKECGYAIESAPSGRMPDLCGTCARMAQVAEWHVLGKSKIFTKNEMRTQIASGDIDHKTMIKRVSDPDYYPAWTSEHHRPEVRRYIKDFPILIEQHHADFSRAKKQPAPSKSKDVKKSPVGTSRIPSQAVTPHQPTPPLMNKQLYEWLIQFDIAGISKRRRRTKSRKSKKRRKNKNKKTSHRSKKRRKNKKTSHRSKKRRKNSKRSKSSR